MSLLRVVFFFFFVSLFIGTQQQVQAAAVPHHSLPQDDGEWIQEPHEGPPQRRGLAQEALKSKKKLFQKNERVSSSFQEIILFKECVHSVSLSLFLFQQFLLFLFELFNQLFSVSQIVIETFQVEQLVSERLQHFVQFCIFGFSLLQQQSGFALLLSLLLRIQLCSLCFAFQILNLSRQIP